VKPSEVLEGRTNERTATAGEKDKDSPQRLKNLAKNRNGKFLTDPPTHIFF